MDEKLKQQIHEAMTQGNTSLLHELAPCDCCCDEHYFLSCPAHAWMGCRGSYAEDRLEREERRELRGY